MLRRLAFKLHHVTGLLTGILLLVLSLTGSVLVYRHEIDRLLNPDLLQVTPGAAAVPLDEVVAQARQAVPGETVRIIGVPKGPTEPYEIRLAGAEAPLVYVDPYSGRVLGTRHEADSFVGFLFKLHTELLAGERGAWIVGGTGLLLVGLCLSGLVLWWPGRRKIRLALTVAWRRSRRRVLFDLHRAGGFWTVAFLLIAAITGTSLVFYTAAGKVLDALTLSETQRPAPPPSAGGAGARPVSLASALRTAQAALPAAAVTFVYPALQPDAPITVRMRLPGELHPNGRSYVYVDQYSGRASLVWDALRAGRGERLLNTFYPLHIGRFAGPVVRFLYLLLGLAPAGLALTGFLMWRSRKRGPERPPRSARPPVPRTARDRALQTSADLKG